MEADAPGEQLGEGLLMPGIAVDAQVLPHGGELAGIAGH